MSRLVSKDVEWRWGEEKQKAVDAFKKVVSRERPCYHSHNLISHSMYTLKSSNYQLGEVIVQEGKPLALSSRKLNCAQRNYTTG